MDILDMLLDLQEQINQFIPANLAPVEVCLETTTAAPTFKVKVWWQQAGMTRCMRSSYVIADWKAANEAGRQTMLRGLKQQIESYARVLG